MPNPHVERRVTELEELMASLLRAQEHTQRGLDQLSREMREFKSEMGDFKDEMRDFKNEMSDFKKEMARHYGELVNQLGTMAEDLVAPGVPGILRGLAGCPEDEMSFSGVRVRKPHATERGRGREFDVVAVCGRHVLIGETRTRLRPADVDDFLSTMQEIRSYFPEHADCRFIGAIATLYPDPSVVTYGERAGLVVLGLGKALMEVRNSPGFAPTLF